MPGSKPKLIAVASGGGHWRQMMLLSPAFKEFDVVYVSTDRKFVDYQSDLCIRYIKDTNRSSPLSSVRCALDAVKIIHGEKPDAVVSTGALPGFIFIVIACFSGVTTLWLDSFANSERPSLCGKFARYFVDHWLTQWKHLEREGHSEYEGALL